jgi:ABC-type multidrug transport system ATPase subunit
MERHYPPQFSANGFSTNIHQNELLFDLSNVNVFVEKNIILHNLNFKIFKSDFIFLTGHTGAGKTTLLNFLSGELHHYTGELKTSVWSPQSNIFISRVYQDLKIFDELTVMENLNFSYDSSLYQSKEIFLSEVYEYMKVIGLREYENNKVCKLSGGLKQKVAIVRSLLSKPEIILADEPTSNLDRVSSLQLFELLNYLNVKRKMTIIWATHNLELIKQFHGRLISLERGKIIYSGQA